MKLKKLVFTFFVLTFLSNNSFCMQEKFECEKEVSEILKAVKKKVGEKKGQKRYNSLIVYLKKSGFSEKKIEEILENVFELATGYSLSKAEVSIDAISEEIKKELPDGGVFQSILSVKKIASVFNWAIKKMTSLIFDFGAVQGEKESIKKEAIACFKKDMSKYVCLDGEKKKNRLWFENKISFIKDKEGNIKVKFLGVEYAKFKDFEEANKKICCELLCFSTSMATRDKAFFINALKKAKVSNRLHDIFYNLLSGKILEVEEKIHGNIYGKESKGKELAVKN